MFLSQARNTQAGLTLKGETVLNSNLPALRVMGNIPAVRRAGSRGTVAHSPWPSSSWSRLHPSQGWVQPMAHASLQENSGRVDLQGLFQTGRQHPEPSFQPQGQSGYARFPLLRWGISGTERLSYLPRVTQLLTHRSGAAAQAVWLQNPHGELHESASDFRLQLVHSVSARATFLWSSGV